MAAMRWQHARLEKYSAMHRCLSTVTALAYACSTTCSFAPARTAARTTGRSRIDTDRIIVRWSDGLSELEDWEITALQVVVEQMPVLAQPQPRLVVVGTCMRNQTPEMARVIEPAQVHQLVNQHVIAHAVGHQYQAPVETDMARWRARSPSRPLVAYAHTRHLQAVICSQLHQARGQLAHGLPSQIPDGFRGIREAARRASEYLRALPLEPGALLGGEQLRVTAGSPSRNGDTDTSIGSYPDYVASSPGMTNKIHERITIVPRHES